MHAFNSIAMINNHIICMIFVSGIVFTWFQTKRSNIDWWVVIVTAVKVLFFRCSGAKTSPLLSKDKTIDFPI